MIFLIVEKEEFFYFKCILKEMIDGFFEEYKMIFFFYEIGIMIELLRVCLIVD